MAVTEFVFRCGGEGDADVDQRLDPIVRHTRAMHDVGARTKKPRSEHGFPSSCRLTAALVHRRDEASFFGTTQISHCHTGRRDLRSIYRHPDAEQLLTPGRAVEQSVDLV